MLAVEYSSAFVRRYKKLTPHLKEEVKEKITLFKDEENHKRLKVHALKHSMKGRFAFSVNYRDRIVFRYGKDKKTAYLLDVGDHSIYEN